MHQFDIYQSAISFLDLLNEDFALENDAIIKLEVTLDQLAFMCHFIAYTFEPNWPDPPQQDYKAFRTRAQQQFPSFGLYNIPESVTEDLGATAIMVGDAIDDIADIACDLNTVRWCWQHTSQNDALWHLEFGYQNHFGWHLRELQRYIQACKNKV